MRLRRKTLSICHVSWWCRKHRPRHCSWHVCMWIFCKSCKHWRMCFVTLPVSFCFCLLLSRCWSGHSLRSTNFELPRMRDQCYIKVRQTQFVLDAWPFRFSGLKIDENNWLFVFAALLQVIGGGGGSWWCFLLEGMCARAKKKQKGKLGHLHRLSGSPQVLWLGQWFCMRNALYFHWKFLSRAKTQKTLHALPVRAWLLCAFFPLHPLLFVQNAAESNAPRL